MKPSLFSLSAFIGLCSLLLGSTSAADAQDALQGERRSSRISGNSDGGVANEGAEFLLIPTGARAVGMGGAVTAVRGSGEAVLWSPAGLAGLERRGVFFNHSESAFETKSQVLGLLWPTESIGTFAVTYYLVDFGQLASTDVDGSVQGTIGFRNQEFLLSFARPVVGSLEAGVSYKLIQLVLRCEGRCPAQQSFTRTTHAVDLGLIYSNPIGLPITVGGAVRHLGFALEGATEDDPLPTRVRLGVSYKDALSSFTQNEMFVLALAVDLEDQWRELGNPDVMIGSELGVAQFFFLRAGYAFQQTGIGGAALGLGLTHDWFYIDLSRGFDEISAATGEELLQVSFGVNF